MEIILAANINQLERLMFIAEENDSSKTATLRLRGSGVHVVRDLTVVPVFPYLECYLDYDDLNPDDYFALPPSGPERATLISELQRIVGSNTTIYGAPVTERTKRLWVSWFKNSRPWLTAGEITELTTRWNNNSLFLEIGPAWTSGENDPPKVKPVPGMLFDIATQRDEGEEFIAKMPYPPIALWRNAGVGFVQYESQALISNKLIKQVFSSFSPALQTIIQNKYANDNKVLDLIDISSGWTEVIL